MHLEWTSYLMFMTVLFGFCLFVLHLQIIQCFLNMDLSFLWVLLLRLTFIYFLFLAIFTSPFKILRGIFFFYLFESQRESEGARERSYLLITPSVPLTAGAWPGWSQELRTQSWSFSLVAETKLWTILNCLPRLPIASQGTRREARTTGAPIWAMGSTNHSTQCLFVL